MNKFNKKTKKLKKKTMFLIKKIIRSKKRMLN